MSTKGAERSRRERAEAEMARQRRAARLRRIALCVVVLAVLAGVVTVMLLNSRPESSDATRQAPGFSLTATDGSKISLNALRGHNVLYFSEGAGCQSCLVQMAEIERNKAAFDKLDLTVLPIVMNTRDQITRDMAANGVTTPFLLDDGTVSKEYGTLGKGMHAGLPGHSFVLVDRTGRQRWTGVANSDQSGFDAYLAEATQAMARLVRS